MDDIKVYKPTETQDTPFPVQETTTQDVAQTTANSVYSPQVTKDNPMPAKKIAQEVISKSLNTSTRKILGEFKFTPSGALQIGNYEDGQAGDIRISPGGIVARNLSGETTFSIDGDSGNAIFKGTIRAGSVISAGDISGGTLVLSDTGANVVVESGALELNPGADIKLKSNTGDSAKLIFEREDDATKQVEFGLANGGGAPYDFFLDPTAAIGDVTLFLGYNNVFNGIGINVKAGTRVDINGDAKVTGNFQVTGALSKGSGSFDIPHPDPSKPEGTRLRHYFVESPTAGDNLYRFTIAVKGGVATVDLPDYFNYLNCNPQAWVSPVDTLGIARATIDTLQVTIHATIDGIYNLLVIGTRKDPVAMKDWDAHGIEYIK